ncbi:MAG: helix-turn-helix domain-containing protein, partial [Candidatus Curtissbacteria bacterium]|nr:helix-turn-helix domain-containing protein [Candidatus Curtissbacteria bacterium]
TREILKGTNIISDLLSKQEYRLLVFLIQNEGKIAERGEIIEAVWPDIQVQEGISDEAIDQMVFRLRKKIEDEPNSAKHIITVKGRGLRFQP